MGRPREHDERTRRDLLAAAERLVAEGGPDALSIRAVADAAGTTTRAVYSLFGSKAGLVAALATVTFDMLARNAAAVAETDDPREAVVRLGLDAFRPIVKDHPALYRMAFQRILALQPHPELLEARGRAFVELRNAVERLEQAGLLGDKSVAHAVLQIEAMFEGLANTELRGEVLPIMPRGKEERAWREGLTTLLRGFAAAPSAVMPQSRRETSPPRG